MTVPIESLGVLKAENVAAIKTHLETVYLEGGLLTPDVSNYAKGRMRCWLESEGPLSATRAWQPAYHDERLWSFIIKNVWPEAELGMVTYGPVGIKAHRDATYADWEARIVNLGEVKGWQYTPGYSTFGSGPQVKRPSITLLLKEGEVIRFNCKNEHEVIGPAEDRWAINLWRVSGRTRQAYEIFKATQG